GRSDSLAVAATEGSALGKATDCGDFKGIGINQVEVSGTSAGNQHSAQRSRETQVIESDSTTTIGKRQRIELELLGSRGCEGDQNDNGAKQAPTYCASDAHPYSITFRIFDRNKNEDAPAGLRYRRRGSERPGIRHETDSLRP